MPRKTPPSIIGDRGIQTEALCAAHMIDRLGLSKHRCHEIIRAVEDAIIKATSTGKPVNLGSFGSFDHRNGKAVLVGSNHVGVYPLEFFPGSKMQEAMETIKLYELTADNSELDS